MSDFIRCRFSPCSSEQVPGLTCESPQETEPIELAIIKARQQEGSEAQGQITLLYHNGIQPIDLPLSKTLIASVLYLSRRTLKKKTPAGSPTLYL